MHTQTEKGFLNIKYASYWLIGELENTLLDNEEDSEEYKDAERNSNDLYHRKEKSKRWWKPYFLVCSKTVHRTVKDRMFGQWRNP